jgi:hypothetical protein
MSSESTPDNNGNSYKDEEISVRRGSRVKAVVYAAEFIKTFDAAFKHPRRVAAVLGILALGISSPSFGFPLSLGEDSEDIKL